jgi:uncharacterized caspase-like protein
VALVVGNGAYRHAPALANPGNDARAMAAALERLGFEVTLGVDLDRDALRATIRRFAERLDGARTALAFYAGHGVQVGGRNWLLPVDARLRHERDLTFEAEPLDLLLGLMERDAAVNILLFDACRDNPLAADLARAMGTRSAGVGRGLAPVSGGVGTLVAFATQPGNVALDGSGRHSPFTAALLEHIEAPGQEIGQLLRKVRESVIRATRGTQVPWDHSALVGEVVLVPAVAVAAAAPAAPPLADRPVPAEPGPARGPGVDPTALDLAAWQGTVQVGTAEAYTAYRARFCPNGTFCALADAALAKHAALAPPAQQAPPRGPDPALVEAEFLDAMVQRYVRQFTRAYGRPADAELVEHQRSIVLGRVMLGLGLLGPRAVDRLREPLRAYQTALGAAATGHLDEGTFAALLDEPLFFTGTLPDLPPAAERAIYQDWAWSRQRSSDGRLHCRIETRAYAIAGRYDDDHQPSVAVEVEPGWRPGAVAFNLGGRGWFEPDTPIVLRVEGRELSVAADAQGVLAPPVKDGGSSPEITRSLARGRSFALVGRSWLGGTLTLDFSAMGFTAAWRKLSDTCGRGSLLTWIE